MDRLSCCTWWEGQVAIGVVHKLEMFVQPFSHKVVVRDEGICSNFRVVRDLFCAVLQLVGVFKVFKSKFFSLVCEDIIARERLL